MITYSAFQKKDFDALLKMGLKLWQDYEERELRAQMDNICSAENQKVIIAKNHNNVSVGFSVFSIRNDYVEGADKSPTGYLEGIFVESEFRKNGVAKRFIEIGEEWLRLNQCTQIGSDTWLSDMESRTFHKNMGFWEEDELVHFLKDLD